MNYLSMLLPSLWEYIRSYLWKRSFRKVMGQLLENPKHLQKPNLSVDQLLILAYVEYYPKLSALDAAYEIQGISNLK